MGDVSSLEDQMTLDMRISSKLKFVIALHNVPLELLEEKDNTYTLLYEDKQNSYFLALTGNTYEFIKRIKSNEKTKKSLNLSPLFIQKNDGGTVNLFFRAPLNVMPESNDNNEPVVIEFLNKNLSLKLEMTSIPKALMTKVQNARIKDDKEQQRKKEVRLQQKIRESKKAEKKAEIRELVKKVDKIEERNKGHVRVDKELSLKGIYLVDPRSFKRCENCANFTGASVCSAHNVDVSESHRCSRFHAYKTVYGGSFSPK